MAAFDVRVFLYLHHALASVIGLCVVLSVIGSGWAALLLVPMLAWTRTRAVGRALLYVIVLNAIVVYSLKAIVARVRPCNCLPDIHVLMFKTPTDYSFPSGHAAGSFAVATFFAVILLTARTPRRILGAALLLLLAVGVAFSRIGLGVHFPGDVLAGGLIGALIGGVGARLFLRKSRRITA